MNTSPEPLNLTELMNTYAPPLHRYAARLLRDTHAAADVVQQVFLRLSQLPPAKHPAPAATKSWLYRVTHNQAVDHIRSEQRRRQAHETHAERTRLDAAPSTEARIAIVLQHVDQLDEKARSVLLLRLQEGLSYQEISDITGLSPGNVGYVLHHAVREVGEALRREGQS